MSSVRYTFRASESQVKELESIMKEGAFVTRSEVIRTALNLGLKELKKRI